MDVTESGNHKLHCLMQAMRTAIGENAMMAYLAMMAVRLLELHRVLKPTGSLYLHCDPTASHYLKLVLDAVFGAERYRNEIIWKRTTSHNSANRYGKIHDTIFFYTKSDTYAWTGLRTEFSPAQLKRYKKDEDDRWYKAENLTADRGDSNSGKFEWRGTMPPPTRGWAYTLDQLEDWYGEGRILLRRDGCPRMDGLKVYLEELSGQKLQSLWTDIPRVGNTSLERLGYPTQKPVTLLERIIAASSNPGDVVLDPFCGCGTAVDAAQKLGRRWIGIDVTHLAIGLIEKRLREGYGDAVQFETIGVPRDLASAQRLAADDPHQFQAWITLKLGGWPWMGGKKGGDKGVDGYFYYVGRGGQTETGVISVKAGNNVNPTMVRDLWGVMQRDGHKLGLFVSAALPTRGMEQEAASHGLIETEFGRFPALQIFTLAEMFQNRHPMLPPLVSPNRRAPRVETRVSHQPGAQASLI